MYNVRSRTDNSRAIFLLERIRLDFLLDRWLPINWTKRMLNNDVAKEDHVLQRYKFESALVALFSWSSLTRR